MTHAAASAPPVRGGRLDPLAMDQEIAAARATVVEPDHLLNSMAVCKLIYADGVPVDWLHLYTNPAWVQQSGQPSTAGKYATDLFPGINELDPEVLRTFTRVAEGGPPERFTRYLRSAGQWFDVQTYCLRPGYFVAIFDIVTERVERERELQQAQQRLSLAQSASKSGVWDWDVPSGRLFWTPEMFELFGFDAAETAASFDLWRSTVHPKDLAEAEERIAAAIRDRVPMFNEYRIVDRDGDVRWIRAYGNALYDDAGRPDRMLGICIDVTDLKRISQEAADAAAANAAKSRFLASMSHELRTPLNSIIGFTSLLLEGMAGDLNGEQRRQLAIVQRSGQQLLELIAELLDLARVEAGRAAIDLGAVDLRSLLLEQHEALRPIAAERGLAFDAPECPEQVLVQADAKRLSQVIRNLVSNAVKYTDAGSVRMSVRVVGESARIDIEDTGIGIAEGEITRIFSPFRRSADPRSAARAGTGLGLSISRSLVLAMGGNLTVQSRLGAGSTFTVTLPLATGGSAQVAVCESTSPPCAARCAATARY